MSDDRYVFLTEWFDTAAALVRTYTLTYFLKDKTIEMFDIKNKRMFLKRTEYPSIALKDIFVGATLNVYSRQLKVTNYADQFTQAKFEQQRGKALVLIKPDAYLQTGKILNVLEENSFTISNLKVVKLTKSDAEKYYLDKTKQNYPQLLQFLSSDLVMAVELLGDNCIAKLKEIIGHADPQKARSEQPKSIRAIYGQDSIRNAIESSQSATASVRELQFFFSDKCTLTSPAVFSSCSCLVVKPHLITEGYVGQIVDSVLTSGFEISAAEMFWLDRPSAEEFLEIYKGVVPEYNQMVEELTNGPCIAMEVRQDNVVPTLRELCGPHDPQMAKTVRPRSLRATYGKDKARNGVHCTDLLQDGVLEVEYFFNILQRK